ncbi:type II secretion system secretin GspD [Sphingomonas colocasiae]|uniref:Type II secretion system secretin GspD n=1 Tax=Sphingomonas colocasiae TaxID=1848973 RepID=A0ABS7PSQ1_9SPHN|nr:type II secretion system secretin GspD [Sphingomonas colocasiae]MBY8823019.1 type II secretion system secretin GspD [Sphingomonas colocasiae]
MRKVLTGAATAIALLLCQPLAAQQTTLNVRDADVRAFIQDAARVTGRTFIVDQRVQGKVSVVTDRPLSKSEYFEVFLATMRANGLVAIPTGGGAFRIQPADTAAAQPGRVGTRGSQQNAFVTEVFRLRSIDATSAVETLRPLVSKEGSVTANRAGNSVVVADYADNVRRIRQLVQQIDRDSASTTLIALKNAGAREIATSLQQLVGNGAAGADGAARGPSATIVAIDSSNSVVLRGDPSTVSRLAEVARDLDKRAESGTEIRVFWLEYADAGQLLPVLQQLTGNPASQATSSVGSDASAAKSASGATAAPAQTAAAISSVPAGQGIQGRAQAIVTRFEGANAIVIAAPADVQRQLGEVVRQLDTRREQVLVEAIIVEISDNAARNLGVQFLFGGKPGSGVPYGVTNYSNATPNIATIAGAIAARELDRTTTVINGTTVTTSSGSAISDQLQAAAAQQLLAAKGGIAGIAFDIGKDAIFGAIINAVKSDSKSNLLSAPSLMTLDNQEAKFLAGQEIPVTTGEALSGNFDNAFRTVQRQNVGIQLEVKPQIGAGGSVKLFLRQEVSSIAGPVSSDSSDLILNKREITTTVVVDDGQIVALGSLLDDNERRTIEKIPFLGDLPAIGALFRSKARSRAKTNLAVFIRPTIIKGRDDARSIAERRYGYLRDQQLLDRPDREPTLDELVRDYMGAQPPIPVPQTAADQVVAPPPAAPAVEPRP